MPLGPSRARPEDPAADAVPRGPVPDAQVGDALPSGWPWALLRRPGRSVLELEGGPVVPAEVLASAGVKSWRGFFVEQPTLWLFVFELEASGRGTEPLMAWSAGAGPYHAEPSANGRFLLLAGFPTHKPVSPEMQSVQDAYLSAFAGEE